MIINRRLCSHSVMADFLVSAQTDGSLTCGCLIIGSVADLAIKDLGFGLAVGRLAFELGRGKVVFLAMIVLGVRVHVTQAGYSFLDRWMRTKQTCQTTALEGVNEEQMSRGAVLAPGNRAGLTDFFQRAG